MNINKCSAFFLYMCMSVAVRTRDSFITIPLLASLIDSFFLLTIFGAAGFFVLLLSSFVYLILLPHYLHFFVVVSFFFISIAFFCCILFSGVRFCMNVLLVALVRLICGVCPKRKCLHMNSHSYTQIYIQNVYRDAIAICVFGVRFLSCEAI